ncbi:DUF4097 domain-containing protein [Mucilaginibacter robiniae]|uniref:DUF4097 domain-containing protein n=1 Tax=Mucilaginibacter robiniae TaxID=2728022 RepID=A0A7L5DX66_9SPHI|nr:DUF4097 family beta strand repeat-containing protein [Mucilaginibacter robiniae]QJD95692.1 DUF4097 domain-containing protein [Mucilaginibacter robiniae]
MKKFILIAFMACNSLATLAQNHWSEVPYLTQSLSDKAIKEVLVSTEGGSIQVSGVEPSQARIEVYVVPNNNQDLTQEELKQRMEEYYTLRITDNNHELHAKAERKHDNTDWRKSVSIGFKIYVPQMVATNLTTAGGSIHLTNLTGEQNFVTSGGSLHVNQVIGKIKGSTSGGSIHVTNSQQYIELTTSGGSITASNCTGTIKLATSGGSLKLNQLKGDIDASTSGGSVNGDDISGKLLASTSGGSIDLTALACNLEGATSSGSIHVQMREMGKYIKLNTSAGHIDVQLPQQKGLDLNLKGSRVNAAINGSFDGRQEKDRIEGKLNGGGALIEAYASNGSVNVKFD